MSRFVHSTKVIFFTLLQIHLIYAVKVFPLNDNSPSSPVNGYAMLSVHEPPCRDTLTEWLFRTQLTVDARSVLFQTTQFVKISYLAIPNRLDEHSEFGNTGVLARDFI